MGKMFLPEQHHHSACVCVCARVSVCVCDRYRDRPRMEVWGETEKGRVGEREKERGRELVPEKQNIHCYRKEIRKTL